MKSANQLKLMLKKIMQKSKNLRKKLNKTKNKTTKNKTTKNNTTKNNTTKNNTTKNNTTKNNTTKNNTNLKTCDNFCKNDYLPEMQKVYKKSAEKYNNLYKPPTKEEEEFNFNTCTKIFCNKNCEGFDFFGDKKKQKEFKKNLKDGFINTYPNNKIDRLKNKGAVSGCVNVTDYDVFHN
jgi:hypothetical protein